MVSNGKTNNGRQRQEQLICSFCGKTPGRRCERLVAGPGRLHLQRVHRAVPTHLHEERVPTMPRRSVPGTASRRNQDPNARGDQGRAGSVCRRAGRAAKMALCVAVYNHYKRIRFTDNRQRCGTAKEQHPHARPHRLRQDLSGPDAGQDAERALCHRATPPP